MHTVIIIGAGASRDEALALGATQSGLPPLDTDFFRIASACKLASDIEIVQKYLFSNYAIDLSGVDYPRMEEVFGVVYADTMTDPIPSGADLAFFSLCSIYNQVIAKTTNDLAITHDGPMGSLIRHFLDHDSLTILTFNQDIVIERTLEKVGAHAGRDLWYPNTGYEINVIEYTSPRGKGASEKFKLGNNKDSTIKVLKLHGSLNWYMRTRSKYRMPSRLRNKIFCTSRKKLSPSMIYISQVERGRKKWFTWPIIVPPIFERATLGKHSLAFGKKLLKFLLMLNTLLCMGILFLHQINRAKICLGGQELGIVINFWCLLLIQIFLLQSEHIIF